MPILSETIVDEIYTEVGHYVITASFNYLIYMIWTFIIIVSYFFYYSALRYFIILTTCGYIYYIYGTVVLEFTVFGFFLTLLLLIFVRKSRKISFGKYLILLMVIAISGVLHMQRTRFNTIDIT